MHVLSMSEGPAAAIGAEPSIKRTVGRVLFQTLRQHGYRACESWLRENSAQLGKRSTVDIGLRYLSPELTMTSSEALIPELSAG